jgi:hypothetical protein
MTFDRNWLEDKVEHLARMMELEDFLKRTKQSG